MRPQNDLKGGRKKKVLPRDAQTPKIRKKGVGGLIKSGQKE